MKFKKRYIVIPLIILIIVAIIIIVIIKIDRDLQRKQIEQDETEYGSEYLKLTEFIPYYTEGPDRIIYKPKMKDYFYVIDKNDEQYEHLLEVAEDRMCYSIMEYTDSFSVDSMDRIMSSGQNYIILDRDEQNYMGDGLSTETIVYKLAENNRCSRLIKYITQFRKRYTLEELQELIGKTEFYEI